MHLRREILIRNFNKRERIVLELIHQLTVDMRKETVNFVPAEFAGVGIHRNHLYPVFDNLLKAKVLLKTDAGYQINPQVPEWQIKPAPGYREKALRRLFAIHYRNGSTANHQSGSNPSNQISSNSRNRFGGNKEEEKKIERNNIESISYSRESNNALNSL